MSGILVHGDNHFIVDGPRPDAATALELVREWSLIRIGRATPPHLRSWTIKNRELRENLEWAVVVDCPLNPAVLQLLEEIAGRGVAIDRIEPAGRYTEGAMKEKLRAVREQLLALHTILLADTRAEYEQMYGRVKSPNEMLNLVMSHEWFAWLRALSSLIVEMDELLFSKEAWKDAPARTLIDYTEALMVPASEGAVFRQKYYEAVQRNPEVLIEHGKLKKMLADAAA